MKRLALYLVLGTTGRAWLQYAGVLPMPKQSFTVGEAPAPNELPEVVVLSEPAPSLFSCLARSVLAFVSWQEFR